MLLPGNKMRTSEGIHIKIIALFNRNYYIDMYKVKCIGQITNIFLCEKPIHVVNQDYCSFSSKGNRTLQKFTMEIS